MPAQRWAPIRSRADRNSAQRTSLPNRASRRFQNLAQTRHLRGASSMPADRPCSLADSLANAAGDRYPERAAGEFDVGTRQSRIRKGSAQHDHARHLSLWCRTAAGRRRPAASRSPTASRAPRKPAPREAASATKAPQAGDPAKRPPATSAERRQSPARGRRRQADRRQVLFGNPDKASARISPDGTQLSYLAPRDGVLNVWVGPVDDPAAAKPVTEDKKRGIRVYLLGLRQQAHPLRAGHRRRRELARLQRRPGRRRRPRT